MAGRSGMSATEASAVTTVGVLDSGVGGLSVVAAMQRAMPALPVRYIADTARFPYGDRTPDEVAERTLALGARLIDEGCVLLVVACNTASSAALELLRERFDVPIVGMEPPVKPATERTRSGHVAVLATAGTTEGERLARLYESFAGDREVLTVPMPGLADLVEAGEIAGPRVEAILEASATELRAHEVDEVALGCTHYAFLRDALSAMLGPDVEIIDTAEPVARRVRQQLEAHRLVLPEGEPVAAECTATGGAGPFEETLARLRATGADLPMLEVVQEVVA
ncbi:MAG: glutamate racemase [Chloroflexi bacterium]|nr:glutamate racemase [Chloroflexota bacterium]